jgi:hypothetical protein
MLPILIELVSEDYKQIQMSYYYLKIGSKLGECNLKNDRSAAPVDKAKSIINIILA